MKSKNVLWLYKRYLLLLYIVCVLPAIAFSIEEEIIEKTIPLNPDGRITLKNTSGDISVATWNKNEVHLTILKTAKTKGDLDNAQIDIDASEDVIRITSGQKKTLGLFHANYIVVNFKLTIPKTSQIKIESTNGNIVARQTGNPIDVKSICGNVQVKDAQNDINIKTVSGSIDLSDITGNVDIKTTSGPISINHVNGSLEAENISGPIDIHHMLYARKVEVKSISGNILLTGELNASGSYDLASHCGSITLKLPEPSHFELQAKTFSGDIQYDFHMKNIGSVSAQKFYGVSGKGGASLMISSFSGNIRINKTQTVPLH